MRESVLLTLLASVLVTVIALVGTASPQANPRTTVYLDPPTINGTTIGEEFNVSVMIRDAYQINGWQAGLIFNPNLLNCTGFFKGEFLRERAGVADTLWKKGTINNTAGVITPHYEGIYGLEKNATGDGRLGYLTFKVKAPEVSDLHLRDVKVFQGIATEVHIKIIDVYTAVVDTTAHTVVTVSNSTGLTGSYHSGFYGHAFNPALKELSFNVTGPRPGFSNVTIPKTLLNVSTLDKWKVMRDDRWLDIEERTVTYNGTHYSVYFTYSAGIHTIRITTRYLMSSTISITLSSTNITLGSNVTISGAIDPVRVNVTVAVQYRFSGVVTWITLAEVTTDQYSNYSCTWAPETNGTFEVRALWEGDEITEGAESDVKTLTVYWAPPTIYVFEAVWKDKAYYVVVESYSKISDFAFVQPMKEISFNVTGPSGSIASCNVTIPKTLLWESFYVFVNGESIVDKILSSNTTHNSIYFTFKFQSTSKVQIRGQYVVLESSTISINLSSTNITLGSNVTISGAIDPVRVNVTVAVQYRFSGVVTWITLAEVTTDQYSNYSCTWAPETNGTFEVRALWEGDEITEGAESDVKTLTVQEAPEEVPEGFPLEIVMVAVVVIIVIAAVVVYFVKFRKP